MENKKDKNDIKIKIKEHVTSFWTNEPSILYKNGNYLAFFPKKGMHVSEILNSLTRFSIYAIVLLVLFGKHENILMIPIFIIIISYIIHHLDLIQEKDNKTIEQFSKEDIDLTDIDLSKVEKCVRPTKNNPFMNVMYNDYAKNTDRPYACDVENKETKNDMDRYFNNNLFRDVDDIYNRNNSQRQFFTMPVTRTYSDQTAFAKWLYQLPKTCKEDQEACLRYEDLRYKRYNPHTDKFINNVGELN